MRWDEFVFTLFHLSFGSMLIYYFFEMLCDKEEKSVAIHFFIYCFGMLAFACLLIGLKGAWRFICA